MDMLDASEDLQQLSLDLLEASVNEVVLELLRDKCLSRVRYKIEECERDFHVLTSFNFNHFTWLMFNKYQLKIKSLGYYYYEKINLAFRKHVREVVLDKLSWVCTPDLLHKLTNNEDI